MKSARKRASYPQLDRKLTDQGLRLTAQRQEVYAGLVKDLNHPTAQEVFLRAKKRMPEISLATVYNCLEALVTCGVVRRVLVDPAAARFCPNMSEHGHFFCEACGNIFDVPVKLKALGRGAGLPAGFEARGYDLAMRGRCSGCVGQAKHEEA